MSAPPSSDNTTAVTVINEDYIKSRCLSLPESASTPLNGDTITELVCSVEGGCDGGAKVALTVVSKAFEKLPLLKRHRLVNEIFAKELENGSVHALSVKAYTPAQYESKK